jgi:L-lactate utilization protein LutC
VISSLGDRDAFLATIRERLGRGISVSHLRPVKPAAMPPPIRYVDDELDLTGRFIASATALGVAVQVVEDASEFVAAVCQQRGVRRVVVSDDPECVGVADRLRKTGVVLVDVGDVASCATADIGVTGALYGIALTGSLVVDSRRAGGRAASLLPPFHAAILRRGAIVPTPGALFRDLGRLLPDGLPSNLVLITGPSKSADIELELTIGVHGPRELMIALL